MRLPAATRLLLLAASLLVACVSPPPGEGGPVATGSPAPVPAAATQPPPTVTTAAGATSGALCPKGVLPAGGEELRPYFGYEVDRKAELVGSWPTPVRAVGRETLSARVNVMFLVDTTGQVVAGTAKLVSSTGPLDTQAVCDVLAQLRYRPARLTGRQVRMWDQHDFHF
ncbi:MAG: hypothetical protein ACR2OG_01985 [Gemmatimonadaceae bacterium]